MKRDLSLDAFRGLDVVLMVLVNLQGGEPYGMLEHAKWNGLTLADLVFPWFLLIVGLSVPLASEKFPDVGSKLLWRSIFRRAALLFAIGVALNWLIQPSWNINDIRWAGVLQRIAIVYFVCAAVLMARKGYWFSAGLAGGILILHTLLLLKVGAPAGTPPSLASGEGLTGWLDQQFLPGRVLRKTYDPEGILSTLPSLASGLIGVAVMQMVKARDQQKMRGGNGQLFGVAVALTLAGLATTLIVPLNKIYGRRALYS